MDGTPCAEGCRCRRHNKAMNKAKGLKISATKGSGKPHYRSLPGVTVPTPEERRNHRGTANSWHWMMSRCFDPWNSSYYRYGGRGITPVKRWLTFANFLEDMGDRPPGRHWIGRKNHDRPYSRANCYWEAH
jgi:hypothetical protein